MLKNHYCFLFLLAALLAGCEQDFSVIRLNAPAPPFALAQLDSAEVRFPDQYAGKVVAVRFWADWCPSCRSEMMALEPIYRRYHDRGLVILAVNVTQPPETVRAFIKPLGLSYDILLDQRGDVMRDYRVMGLPMTFIVDRQGRLRTRIVGESTPEVFEQAIAGLL